jgi:hypothetical protein
MSLKMMVECDNPGCESVGAPEWIPGQDGRRKRKSDRVIAPYRWHQGSGNRVGCGPSYEYVACTTDCVGPAIAEMERQARAEEDGL